MNLEDKPEDLKINAFTASHQHMLTSPPCGVSIQHIPSGAMARCDVYRSKEANYREALRLLTLTVVARYASKTPPMPPVKSPALDMESFTEWFIREMPAGTVIGDPAWWADKIKRRIQHQLSNAFK